MEENLIPERTEKEETADNKTVGGEKKFGRLKAIGYTLLMILLFYLIQFAITVPIIIVYAFQYIAGIDAPIDMQSFIASITENGLITIVTAVSTVATTLVFALWYYFKYGRLQKRSLPELWGNAFGVKKTILYIVGSLFCYFMASNTISGIDLISPSSVDAYTEMMQQISSGSQGLLLLAVVILAPIGEECLFRGLVFQRFRKYFTIVAAWILQAVFFG
ncbi:MAG TPA: CPBP family intramembrane metalloprotease, partial [Lachnospiraceae bacterium]|nr:CPBP family intramembrane metalloprotease [Lachnospiraceae bacterium]